MECSEFMFTGHALRQMFSRGIRPEEVRQLIDTGELVQDYPDDAPYPSHLLLATVRERVLNAVVARDPSTGRCYVITAYEPDPGRWDPGFRTRR